MGMFDWLKCEYPLPLRTDNIVVPPDTEFQTKDMDNYLAHFRISEEGELQIRVDKPNGQTWTDMFGNEWPEHEFSHWKAYEEFEGIPYTGAVRFYASIDAPDDPDMFVWIEYIAVFQQGKIVNMMTCDRPERYKKYKKLSL